MVAPRPTSIVVAIALDRRQSNSALGISNRLRANEGRPLLVNKATLDGG